MFVKTTEHYSNFKQFLRLLKSFSVTFIPVPKRELYFLLGKDSIAETFFWFRALSVPLVIWLTVRFYRTLRKSAHSLFFYLSGTSGLCALFYFIYPGSIRHHGFFFIVLIMSLWLFHISEKNAKEKLKPISAALTAVLSLHLIAGVTAVFTDNLFLFSNGKRTAEFIQKTIPADTSIFTHPEAKTDAVTVYMERGTRIFFPVMDNGRGGKASFYDFSPTTLSEGDLRTDFVLERARKLADEENQNVLLILNRQLGKNFVQEYGLVEKASFTGAVDSKENFYLYTGIGPAP